MPEGITWLQVLGVIVPVIAAAISAYFGWVNARGQTLGNREAGFRKEYLERLKTVEDERDELRLEHTKLTIANARLEDEKRNWLEEKTSLEGELADARREIALLKRKGGDGG
jgi:hypothetical protein